MRHRGHQSSSRIWNVILGNILQDMVTLGNTSLSRRVMKMLIGALNQLTDFLLFFFLLFFIFRPRTVNPLIRRHLSTTEIVSPHRRYLLVRRDIYILNVKIHPFLYNIMKYSAGHDRLMCEIWNSARHVYDGTSDTTVEKTHSDRWDYNQHAGGG